MKSFYSHNISLSWSRDIPDKNLFVPLYWWSVLSFPGLGAILPGTWCRSERFLHSLPYLRCSLLWSFPDQTLAPHPGVLPFEISPVSLLCSGLQCHGYCSLYILSCSFSLSRPVWFCSQGYSCRIHHRFPSLWTLPGLCTRYSFSSSILLPVILREGLNGFRNIYIYYTRYISFLQDSFRKIRFLILINCLVILRGLPLINVMVFWDRWIILNGQNVH